MVRIYFLRDFVCFPKSTCRDIMFEYSKQVMEVGYLVVELLSEALGLNSNHLKDMGCAEGMILLSQSGMPTA